MKKFLLVGLTLIGEMRDVISATSGLLVLLVGVNFADAKTPEVTRDFLIFCRQEENIISCYGQLGTVGAALMISREQLQTCVPEVPNTNDRVVWRAFAKPRLEKTLAWIEARPALLNAKTFDSLAAAIKALWLC